MHAARGGRRQGKKSALTSAEDGCYNCGPNVNSKMMASSTNPSEKAGSGIAGSESCSWFEISYLVKELAKKAGGKKYDCILAIANGGLVPARLLAEELGMDAIQLIPVRKKEIVKSEMPRLDRNKRYLLVDDIYDTGRTHSKVAKELKGYRCDYAFCMSRYDQGAGIYGRILNHNRWIIFPWEASPRNRES